jgi:hypothetical protein
MGVRLISRLKARVSGQRGAATTTEAVLHVHSYRVGRAVRAGQESVPLTAGATSERFGLLDETLDFFLGSEQPKVQFLFEPAVGLKHVT